VTERPADIRWMKTALSLGRRGMGRTWPNPAVGCVIVKDGRVLGRGFTQTGGRPHAETMALAQAGPEANGAVAYVTLEPCAHHGQTPPCARALIAAKIKRVVSAMEDPDPRVAGKGHALLRAANIEVDIGCLGDLAAEDHAGFLLRTGQGRPFVTLKLASSLDGRIATSRGESQWITGPEARRLGQYLRATHDAVMVGAGTARADDPLLTVRDLRVERQPVRVICDTNLSVRPDSRLAQSIDTAPLWLCHDAGVPDRMSNIWRDTDAKLIGCARAPRGLDLADVLSRLASAGLTRIYCEGGGQLAASLLALDMVDQLVMFSAGLALGASGVASVGDLPAQALADFSRFRLGHTREIGGDTVSFWRKP